MVVDTRSGTNGEAAVAKDGITNNPSKERVCWCRSTPKAAKDVAQLLRVDQPSEQQYLRKNQTLSYISFGSYISVVL